MCIRDRYQRRVHGAPGYDFTLPIFLKGNEIPVYVYKRPGVDFFLRRVTKLFEVVIYTASLSDYANPVIDRLDPERQIPFRLFREHCTLQEGIYVKDLDRLGRDLKDVIIIDNSPNSFKLHQGNAIRVENFIDDREDRELLEMLPFVEFLAEMHDVRFVEEWQKRYRLDISFDYPSQSAQGNQMVKRLARKTRQNSRTELMLNFFSAPTSNRGSQDFKNNNESLTPTNSEKIRFIGGSNLTSSSTSNSIKPVPVFDLNSPKTFKTPATREEKNFNRHQKNVKLKTMKESTVDGNEDGSKSDHSREDIEPEEAGMINTPVREHIHAITFANVDFDDTYTNNKESRRVIRTESSSLMVKVTNIKTEAQ
eukprot:TRINITY_DN4610_c0_g2_i4.p1 TRINITY_DN4610_c0_g2~~TRINITY_DN4610_c0_g2_i4.p1  ORF type:complete len:396 (-),score=77.28 TRINITY_DN4610_c0_g2_i4:356-1453(-)